MLQTSLYDIHKSLGAKMISFGGWDMPRDYRNGSVSEVKACRSGIGLFDVSHMGEFRVVGVEALDFIQYVITNDASRLSPGNAQYSLVLNEAGGVIDDVIVYCQGPENFLVVVNAGCKEKDWEWFSRQVRSFNAALSDESTSTALIAVQGPKAIDCVQSLSSVPLQKLKRFQFTHAEISGTKCTVSRTGYTGEDGFELFCAWDEAPNIWNSLIAAGASPCGLAARDILRLEAAYPLFGHELSEALTPLGLGLSWAIKTSKPNFIGRNDIIRRGQDGIREQLAGLTLTASNNIPREGQLIFAPNIDDPIGRVTSGTLSPMLNTGIALARIGSGFVDPGILLSIDIRGRRAEAVVTKLPFYRGLSH
jgi:aminomethyltransferase